MVSNHPTFKRAVTLCAAALALLLLIAPTQAAECPPNSSCAPATGSASQSCGPGFGGSPCGGAGPATQGNSSDTQQGAGNPINVINGNKFQTELDMPALPGVLGLEVVRHYNSQYARPNNPTGILGHGWKFSYETRLYPGATKLQIVQADGTRIIFNRDPADPSLCASTNPAQGRVSIDSKPRGNKYTWRWPNGRELLFDSEGKLLHIAAPTGEFVSLLYDPKGYLLRVSDPQGRTLSINYLDNQSIRSDPQGKRYRGVQSVDTPLGRIDYAYTYGDGQGVSKAQIESARIANLVRASFGGITRSYHHEDPRHSTLLTGMTVQGQGSDGLATSQRISTYGYDHNASANLSVRGEPARLQTDGVGKVLEPKRLAPGTGVGQVTLNTSTPGQTVLTNSLGQTTLYRHAIIGNEWRLLQVTGAGCASCGEVNIRYGYDTLGRLTEETRLTKDGAPRETTRHTRDARSRIVKTERIGYLRGKPQGAQWQLRYEYANDAYPEQPTLVARPSVVAGQEHLTRINFNDRGQPTEISETGWSPPVGPQPAQPIARTTTFSYQSINGRSVLKAIDGPLPNGPQARPEDSDITTVQWDKTGSFIQAMVGPGMNTRLVYDWDGYNGTGRVVQTLSNDGYRQVRSQTTYSAQANIALQPVAVQKTAWLMKGGQIDDASQQSQWTLQTRHDALGRLTQHTGPDGITRKPDYAQASDIQSPMPVQSGSEIRALVAQWGEPGTAAANEILKFETSGRGAERHIDDFGRVVAIRNPGQAWQYARYDQAGHLIEIQDPRGMRQLARYNQQGRLIALQRQNGQATEQTIELQWAGRLKQSETVRDAQGQLRHQTRYTHNALGWVTAQEATIPDVERTSAVTLRSSTHFDAWGKPLSKTLPSGKRLAYRYYADEPHAHQLAAIEQIRWPAWLDWLMLPLARVLPQAWLPKTVIAQMQPSEPLSIPPPSASDMAPTAQAGLSATAPGEDFDAAGLPRTLVTAQGRYQLRWNAAGQLQEVRGGERATRYSYDVQGRRASKITAAGTEYYFYEGTQLIAVATRKSSTRDQLDIGDEYAYVGYRAVAWLKDQKSYTIDTDHRGAVLAVRELKTDQPIWQSRVSAWGLVERDSAAREHDPKLRLVNQYYDEETGLHYNLGRYYDPTSGRFISPDPSGIADSIDSQTPGELKLDITAYAAGQPDLFFDPDGAAKITYFAITTGDKGQALGDPQGFKRARWAFIIEDIKAGGSASVDLGKVRNQYAQDGTKLLFDKGGDFIGKKDDPLIGVQANGTAIKWVGADGNETATAFGSHYAANLIGVSQFKIVDFDDDQATKLIQYLSRDAQDRKACDKTALGWLPEIKFAPGEDNIDVTKTAGSSAYPATAQRILNCNINNTTTLPVQYANDVERDRVEKIEAAAEAVETSRLDRDCNNTGCPGVDIVGQTRRIYHASYGRTQFIGATFLRTVNGLSAQDKEALGLNADMQQRLNQANTRAGSVGGGNGWFSWARNNTNCENVAGYWDNAGQAGAMSAADQARFIQQTQLDRQVFIDMVCFVPEGKAKPLGEGRQAFVTESIFADATLKGWMMDIFKSTDKFNFLSRTLIRDNLRTVLGRSAIADQIQNTQATGSDAYFVRQRAIERNVAMRTARVHNSGGGNAYATNVEDLLANDAGGYVSKFLGDAGNWPSLRCGMPTNHPARWHGLQISPLELERKK